MPDYSGWLTVTEAAELLVKDLSCEDLTRAKARVSTAANCGIIRSNGGKKEHRLLDPVSVNAWRLLQRDKASDAADAHEPHPYRAPKRTDCNEDERK